jgi:hypothetical protein
MFALKTQEGDLRAQEPGETLSRLSRTDSPRLYPSYPSRRLRMGDHNTNWLHERILLIRRIQRENRYREETRGCAPGEKLK